MVLPTGMLTVSLMLPLPLTEKPVALPVCVVVYVTPVIAAGNTSATVAPVTTLGPALVTIIVYVTNDPGTALATPSLLVICRSARGVKLSESKALLLPGVGSVTPTVGATVAVLSNVPVDAALIVVMAV